MDFGKIQMSSSMGTAKVLDCIHGAVTTMQKGVLGTTQKAEAKRQAYGDVLRFIADILVVP